MKAADLLTHQPAAVQHPLLQGRQQVSALWFPTSWFEEHERARRLLATWRHGASALRFAQGDLLQFRTPFEQDCETLGAWVLTKQGRGLCSAPLSDTELAGLPPADIHVVHGAQCLSLNLEDGQPLDPAQWLAVSAIALHETFDCRVALPESVTVAPMESRSVREVLDGKLPPASAEQLAFMRAMEQRRQAFASDRPKLTGSSSTPSYRSPIESWKAALIGITCLLALVVFINLLTGSGGAFPVWLLIALAMSFVVRRISRSSANWSSAGQQQAGSSGRAGHWTAGNALPPRKGRRNRRQAWRDWLARLAVTSQVSRLLGQRQAAYVRKMLELFESGKLDEALRHAIPLGGDGESLGQAFGTPTARNDLRMNRGPSHRTSIHLGSDLDSYLRKLYRQSFEKLDREGRIDEAVFVLADLLEAKREALDYLEKHERYKQGAELSLGWDQPAEVIVRLYSLAGDWRKAVAVARRDAAFSAAVLQLEKKWPDVAQRLREEWARALALQGDWLGAVEAIWPIASKRAMAVQWLESAQAAGGQLGARALVKRAVLLPDTLTAYDARLRELRDDHDLHSERLAMSQALFALKQTDARITKLGRVIAPAVLADHGAGRGSLSRNDLQRLISIANDPWLTADLMNASLPAADTAALAVSARTVQGRLPDAGSISLLDAAPLDDKLFLVAFGEAGAAIVNRHGKIVSRFAIPAEQIVIAHSRQVALAIARRDRVCRVSRLDIANRRVVDLGMAELGHIGTEFDGIAWTVADGSRLRVLDTQHSLHDVLWQVTYLPGEVCDLSVNSRVEQVKLKSGSAQHSLWRYALPQRRLLARDEVVSAAVSDGSVQLLGPNGGVIDVWLNVAASGETLMFRLHGRTQSVVWNHTHAEGDPIRAQVAGPWLLVGLGDESTIHWCLISLSTARVCAEIDWPADTTPKARLSADDVILFDTRGRLWALDTTTCIETSIGIH